MSNGRTVLSDINNPAAGAVALESGENEYKFGIFSSIGIGAEYGDVDNMFNEIDATANDIQQVNITFDNIQATTDDINSTVDDANKILTLVEQGGYGKAFTSMHAPIMPIVISHKALGGSLVFDVNGSVLGRMGALAEEINVDTTQLNAFVAQIDGNLGNPITDFNAGDLTLNYNPVGQQITYNIRNDSTVLLKASGIVELAMDYSRKIFQHQSGNLFTGLRGKYFRVELVRDIEKLSDLQEESQDYFENFDRDNAEVSNGFGVDFGALWVSSNYRIGATLININEPSFNYNKIDLSARGYTYQPIIDALTADEIYTMEMQAKFEAAVFSANQSWVFGGSVDANAIKDPVGDEYQWANASVAYITDSWLIPGGRLGYRKNLAGTELSMAEIGLTLFKVLNLDVAYGLEDVEIDNEVYPRTFIVNLGMELSF
ncbi:conjugal transfer protein TraF [Kaarinaea lacus]